MPIRKQWITSFWFDEEIKSLPKDTCKENEKFVTNDIKKKLMLPYKSKHIHILKVSQTHLMFIISMPVMKNLHNCKPPNIVEARWTITLWLFTLKKPTRHG